eukprot:COSAG06_NODE_2273_length_7196_cov_6.990982_3_plen_203_part_00
MHALTRALICWGCICTVVYFEKGFDWFVVMYACTVAAVVLNSFRTAFYSDIWPVGARPLRTLSSALLCSCSSCCSCGPCCRGLCEMSGVHGPGCVHLRADTLSGLYACPALRRLADPHCAAWLRQVLRRWALTAGGMYVGGFLTLWLPEVLLCPTGSHVPVVSLPWTRHLNLHALFHLTSSVRIGTRHPAPSHQAVYAAAHV